MSQRAGVEIPIGDKNAVLIRHLLTDFTWGYSIDGKCDGRRLANVWGRCVEGHAGQVLQPLPHAPRQRILVRLDEIEGGNELSCRVVP